MLHACAFGRVIGYFITSHPAGGGTYRLRALAMKLVATLLLSLIILRRLLFARFSFSHCQFIDLPSARKYVHTGLTVNECTGRLDWFLSSFYSDVGSSAFVYAQREIIMLMKQNAERQEERISIVRKFQPFSIRNYHQNQVSV